MSIVAFTLTSQSHLVCANLLVSKTIDFLLNSCPEVMTRSTKESNTKKYKKGYTSFPKLHIVNSLKVHEPYINPTYVRLDITQLPNIITEYLF